jgi:Reverse transcriptase (RNA-dependent DNA polymerase)
VDDLLKKGFVHVVDADLKSYFDTIPHDRLMSRLRERLADGGVLGLIESFLKAGIMDGLKEWQPEEGAPQGAVLSPLLSNIYLNPLDQQLAAQGYQMVRYADDFVILCRSQSEAEQALAQTRQWCEAAGLTLHPTKTRIVDVRQAGFDFLGYHFQTTQRGRLARWPRQKSRRKLKETLRGKTRRTNGNSLQFIIADVSRTLLAGLATSATVVGSRSVRWTAGSACVCGVSCASVLGARATGTAMTTDVGPMRSLRGRGYIIWKKPTTPRVNPLRGNTINGRAGCGKSCAAERGAESLTESGETRREVSGPSGLPEGESQRGKQHAREAGVTRRRLRCRPARPA